MGKSAILYAIADATGLAVFCDKANVITGKKTFSRKMDGLQLEIPVTVAGQIFDETEGYALVTFPGDVRMIVMVTAGGDTSTVYLMDRAKNKPVEASSEKAEPLLRENILSLIRPSVVREYTRNGSKPFREIPQPTATEVTQIADHLDERQN